jgi:hypothetical protein
MPRIGENLSLEPSLDEEDYINDHRKDDDIDEEDYILSLQNRYQAILGSEKDFD